jgi:hypothetical protein
MSWFVVDVESDGPIPPSYSMVCFGIIKVQEDLEAAPTFYGQTRPISDNYNEKSLSIGGFTREQHEGFDDPKLVMERMDKWISENNSSGRPIFLSDNPAYDFQWINYYSHTFLFGNPFGYSARRIGDLYCGLVKDSFAQWKHLRKYPHNHDPVMDARGNASAILEMKKMGLKVQTK